MPRSSNNKRKNGKDFPKLLTVREYAALVLEGRRSVSWVQDACKRGQILASQIVGGDWVIAEDSLIRPRHMAGFPNELIDMDLPLDLLVPGESVEVEPPQYHPKHKDLHKLGDVRKVKVPSLRKIRLEKGLSQYDLHRLSGVTRQTQRNAERGWYVHPATVLKLADGLDVDVEDLLKYER